MTLKPMKITAWVLVGVLSVCILVYFLVKEPEAVGTGSTVAARGDSPDLDHKDDDASESALVVQYSPQNVVSRSGLVSEQTSDTVMDEEILAHLNQVFLSSVYPLFQYEFNQSEEARIALGVFVSALPAGMNLDELTGITNMLEAHINNADAEHLSDLIKGVYLIEQKEGHLMSEQRFPETMDEQLKLHQEMGKMREMILGKTLAKWYFDGAEEEPELQAELQAEHDDPLSNSTEQNELMLLEEQWEARYQAYNREKQVIENAGLDQQEKQKQVEVLLAEHFKTHEIEAARIYDQFKSVE